MGVDCNRNLNQWLQGQARVQQLHFCSFGLTPVLIWKMLMLLPLYGILSDSLPLFGYRRCSYLFLCSAMAGCAYVALSAHDTVSGQ